MCLFFPFAAPAVDEGISDFEELDLEELLDVVFSASKHEQSIFWSPSAITVFTRKDIRESGATTITDLLRRVPGFDIYEMKPSFPLVGARALTDHSNNLILVLINGREPLVELTGWPVWVAMGVDLEEVERIEVIRGPGSTLYGANAFAGVVSITTVSDRPLKGGDVYLSGGNQGQRLLYGRVRNNWSLGEGTLDFSASLSTMGRLSPSDRENEVVYTDIQSNGYVRYRKGQHLNLSLHAGAVRGKGYIFMMAGDFIANNITNLFEMAKVEVCLADWAKLKTQVYHSHFYGDFHFRSQARARGIWLGDIPDFYMNTHSIDGQTQVDLEVLDRLLLIAGAYLRYTTNESDKILPTDMTELRGAAFFQVKWSPWDVFQLTAGLRADLNNQTEAALSPRAVAVFRPWPDHAFRLGYGLAFRKPAFIENQVHIEVDDAGFPEVVEKLRTAIGNEDLVNEKVHSFEAGWRAAFADDLLRVSVDLFYNIYANMINFTAEMQWDSMGRPDILASTFEFLNETHEITAVGGEAEAVIRLQKGWVFWGNLGLRRVADDRGERLVSEPTLRANLGCRWDPAGTFYTDLALHYVSEYAMPLTSQNLDFENPQEVSLGDNLLLVGRLGYRMGMGEDREVEAGLSLRAPIGGLFKEYPGISIESTAQSVTASDFGGETLVRLVSFYLRGSF
ncbi:TonB-dependent receptor plug domain-containing protein [Myxococcota bacterium]